MIARAPVSWACKSGFVFLFMGAQLLHGAKEEAPQPPALPAITVRTAIYTSNKKWGQEDEAKYRALFEHLQQAAESFGIKLSFEAAKGDYLEIVRWCEENLVDIAIVYPAVYSEIVKTDDNSEWQFLATLVRSEQDAANSFYRSAVVVHNESPVQSVDDIIDRATQEKLTFLSPSLLSTSGSIVPRAFIADYLQANRRDLKLSEVIRDKDADQPNVELLGSGTSALIRLKSAENTNRRQEVAFVSRKAFDRFLDDHPDAPLRMIPVPELETGEWDIPESAVVVRKKFLDSYAEWFQGEDVARWLAQHPATGPNQSFKLLVGEDHVKAYQRVQEWKQLGGVQAQLGKEEQEIDWPRFFTELDTWESTHEGEPRVALVLSGGGAKCAYQVGALQEIERQFAQRGDRDISLVVGTSGGALNAVAAALGLTRHDSPDSTSLEHIWEGLDVSEIVYPQLIASISVGLWLFLIAVVLILSVVQFTWRTPERKAKLVARDRRAWWVVGGFLALAAIEIAFNEQLGPVLARIAFSIVSVCLWILFGWLDLEPFVELVEPWWIRGCMWAGLFALTAGLILLATQFARQATGSFVDITWKRLQYMGGWILCGLVLVQAFGVFMSNETLSGGTGVEAAVSDGFRDALVRSKKIDEESGGEDLATKVLENLDRDLVITATTLSASDESVPHDLYFFATANVRGIPPRHRPYGIYDLRQDVYSQQFFEILIGSCTVYPLLPSRRISLEGGEDVRLVDGGFAHNSPIEAAVNWGATHIIVVEASPDDQPAHSAGDDEDSRNLANGVVDAFNHLFDAAQIVDRRVRDTVWVGELRPTESNITTWSFKKHRIENAISDGRRRARDGMKRQPTPPIFDEHLFVSAYAPTVRPAAGN